MTIAFVNGYAPSYNSGGTPTGSIGCPAQSHSAGNSVVIAVRSVNAAGGVPIHVARVLDTAGNSYVRCGAAEVTDTSATTEVWLASDITGHAANVITVEFESDTQYARAAVAQYSGAIEFSASGALTVDGSSVSSHSGGTVTTVAADELVLGGVFSYDGGDSGAISGASGTTVRVYDGNGFGSTTGIADRAAATAGDYALTITSAASTQLVIITRSFKSAVAGGGDLTASVTIIEGPDTLTATAAASLSASASITEPGDTLTAAASARLAASAAITDGADQLAATAAALLSASAAIAEAADAVAAAANALLAASITIAEGADTLIATATDGTPAPAPALRPIRLSSIIAPRIEIDSTVAAGIALDSLIMEAH